MKRLSKKTTIITNVLICIAVLMVYVISFMPNTATEAYGKGTINAIYNGNRQSNKISLMFNVYENTKVVNKILDVLDEKGVKATFFVGGCWADDNGQTLNRIVKSGHELGNHAYFHKDHKKLDYSANVQEISLTGEIVKALCGYQMNLFAPPSGSFSNTTLKACYDLGYKVIMWSKDTIDWRDKDTALIYKRATNNASGGDLVLMHPKTHTLEVLPSIIDYYLSIGLDLSCVSDNINDGEING